MKCGEYTLVKAPPEYPGKKYRSRWCYEHHLIYWQTYGIIIKHGELIHHKNKDKRDNSPRNLELLRIKEHNIIHPKRQNKAIIMLCCCEYCKVIYPLSSRKYRYKKKKGAHFFCSRRCIGKAIGGGRNT